MLVGHVTTTRFCTRTPSFLSRYSGAASSLLSRSRARRRVFSTDEPPGDGQRPPATSRGAAPAKELAEATARGVGQVIFLNDVNAGLVIGFGLALADPYLAGLAGLGAATATGTSTLLGLDKGAVKDGLMGYNGCLCGCAAAVFGSTSVVAATTATIAGAAVTVPVALSLQAAMGRSPQWTLAFNLVTLTSLLRSRPLLVPSTKGEAAEAVEAVNGVENASGGGNVFAEVLASPLTGISQIFVVQSAMSGAVILGGIASYSPRLAAHALCGSATGTVVGALSGAPLEELTAGLYGFNSALTSMAVGVFFVNSAPTLVLSAGGAAATASLFGAMKAVFGAYGAPCLTLPFCFAMSGCYLLHGRVPGLLLARAPHSPEKNTV